MHRHFDAVRAVDRPYGVRGAGVSVDGRRARFRRLLSAFETSSFAGAAVGEGLSVSSAAKEHSPRPCGVSISDCCAGGAVYSHGDRAGAVPADHPSRRFFRLASPSARSSDLIPGGCAHGSQISDRKENCHAENHDQTRYACGCDGSCHRRRGCGFQSGLLQRRNVLRQRLLPSPAQIAKPGGRGITLRPPHPLTASPTRAACDSPARRFLIRRRGGRRSR